MIFSTLSFTEHICTSTEPQKKLWLVTFLIHYIYVSCTLYSYYCLPHSLAFPPQKCNTTVMSHYLFQLYTLRSDTSEALVTVEIISKRVVLHGSLASTFLGRSWGFKYQWLNDMSLHGLQTVYSTSKMGKNGFGWKLEQGGTRDNKKISTNSIQIWMETHYCTKVCSNRWWICENH